MLTLDAKYCRLVASLQRRLGNARLMRADVWGQHGMPHPLPALARKCCRLGGRAARAPSSGNRPRRVRARACALRRSCAWRSAAYRARTRAAWRLVTRLACAAPAAAPGKECCRQGPARPGPRCAPLLAARVLPAKRTRLTRAVVWGRA